MSYLPTTFQFESRAVRSVTLNDAPWFVAADVCAALGLSNPSAMIAPLGDDEKGLRTFETLGGVQNLAVINEAGLYTVTLRCREALTAGTLPYRFRKWVTSEVLPAIRRTGTYAPQADRTDHNLRLVAECRRTFGKEAARGLWVSLGLPAIQEPAQAAPRIGRPVFDLTARVAAKIEAANGNGIYRRALMRQLSDRGRAVFLDKAIAELAAQGRVTAETHRRAVGGSSSTLYRWISDAERSAPVAASLPH